jgi:hypothetical protein
MDKRIIHAVAGSGKTRYIIESLDLDTRIAIITYTITNQIELKNRIIKKFGRLPDNIHVFGLFQFLYSFCLRPYYCEKKLKGIDFNNNNTFRDFNGDYIYSNKISKVLINGEREYINRINRFFDVIYIDEFQDLTAYDFEFALSLIECSIKVVFLGDFFQKTYSSSQVGNKGSRIHSSFELWKKKLSAFKWEDRILSNSVRCPIKVCDFIRNEMGINIKGTKDLPIEIKELTEIDEIVTVLEDDAIKKLFYQKSYEYPCNAKNWGDSKGSEYESVCVVINNTTYKAYQKNNLSSLVPQTLSKFYVACTRTKGNLYFIEEKKVKNYYKDN